jgi:hypothetical protein
MVLSHQRRVRHQPPAGTSACCTACQVAVLTPQLGRCLLATHTCSLANDTDLPTSAPFRLQHLTAMSTDPDHTKPRPVCRPRQRGAEPVPGRRRAAEADRLRAQGVAGRLVSEPPGSGRPSQVAMLAKPYGPLAALHARGCTQQAAWPERCIDLTIDLSPLASACAASQRQLADCSPWFRTGPPSSSSRAPAPSSATSSSPTTSACASPRSRCPAAGARAHPAFYVCGALIR